MSDKITTLDGLVTFIEESIGEADAAEEIVLSMSAWEADDFLPNLKLYQAAIDHSNSVEVVVERSMWLRIHKALLDSHENTTELLNTHLAGLGTETKKNAFISEMYETEMRELDLLIKYVASNGGIK